MLAWVLQGCISAPKPKEFPSNFSLEEMLNYGDFPRQLTDKVYELIEDYENLKTKSEEDYDNLVAFLSAWADNN